MKVQRDSFEVESTMSGEKVAMAIRTEDSVHLMGLLTDLYKDRLLAILREYSTNALDAHVAAGVSLPIEITLPGNFNPVLTIRDYGVGLSQDDIREIYSQYGASSKRQTNDQVGMLGIGCKSGLTYTNQFTVVSVKGGRKITVLVSRDEDGAGTMQTLSNEPTDEANGTSIQVSIRRDDIYRAATTANQFFAYWKPGTVLIDGKAPEQFTGLKITDSIYVTEAVRQDKVVMGNVPYPVEFQNNGARTYSIVAFVPIGTVMPTPAREALVDTRATVAAMQKIMDDFNHGIKGAIQREVDKASSPQDAIRVIIKWARYIGDSPKAGDYSYKGIPVPAAFTPVDPTTKIETPLKTVTFRDYYSDKNKAHAIRSLKLADWPSTIWVGNYTPENFTANHKKKLRQWAEDNKVGQQGEVERYVLCPFDAPSSKFIDPAYVVDWEVVKAIKLPKTASGSYYGSYKSIPGSYPVYTEAGFTEELAGKDIRRDVSLFWVRGNQWEAERYRGGLKALYPKFTLVCLSQNRIEKFKRDAPAAKPVREGLESGYKKWVATLDPRDLKALRMQDQGWTRQYVKLDPLKVNDPALKDAIALARRDLTTITNARQTFRGLVPTPEFDVKVAHPMTKYSLYSYNYGGFDNRQMQHLYCYLNAAFKEGLVK